MVWYPYRPQQFKGVFFCGEGPFMKWFRLWVDILDDHKIAQLSDYEFRTFIFLLACASEEDALNGTLTRLLPDINRRCRRRIDWLNKAFETFQRLGLVEISSEGIITITNWNKRQFQTDDSYKRVKKHREKQAVRNVSVTVNETPPDTDTDTDTDKKKVKRNVYSSEFETFWMAYPKRSGSKSESWKNWEKLNGERPDIEIILAAIESQITWRKNSNGEFRPEWKDPERWIKGKMWEVDLTSASKDDLDLWAMK
jgi:hypothetical protein